MNEWRQRKYVILLITLLLLLFVAPALHSYVNMQLLLDGLRSVLLIVALLVVFTEKYHRSFALLLAILSLVGCWIDARFPALRQVELLVGLHLVNSMFLGLTIITVLRNVYSDTSVSVEHICGALCGYLLLGLMFGHLYCGLETLAPGSFRGDTHFAEQVTNEDQRFILLTYFSFTTMTTVGFGDITAATDAVRGMAIVEAILGQFYIAVLIGDLIGKRVSQSLGGQPSD